MKSLKNKNGFTLIEMIVAGMIASIVVASALGVYLTQHKHLIVQDQISDMQQNIRAGMQELATKIRMAGYDVPQGISALNAYNTDPDTIEFLYDSDYLEGVTIDRAMPRPSAELTCDGDISSLTDSDWIFIYDPVADTGEFFEITHVQAPAGHIQHNTMPLTRCYPAGSMIIRMNKIKYFVDNTTDPDHPRLMFENVGDEPQIYADNITDLQLRYVLSSGVTVDVPPVANMVREVLINLTARTDRADEAFEGLYRTRNLQTKVKVRNLAIN